MQVAAPVLGFFGGGHGDAVFVGPGIVAGARQQSAYPAAGRATGKAEVVAAHLLGHVAVGAGCPKGRELVAKILVQGL